MMATRTANGRAYSVAVEDSATLLLVLLLTSMNSVFSQIVITEGTLSTNQTAAITLQGDLINKGNMIHRGHLTISGDFANAQNFFADTSTLELNGASDQKIETIDQSIGTLIVNGNGRKSIIGKMLIRENLLLQQGVVASEAILQLASTASITGGSFLSYVDGFLYHSGTGEKFYPVGRNGTYAPATLLNVTGDNPSVGVAYFPASVIAGPTFHWQQRVLEGTYEGATAQLTFTSDDADYQDYSPELVVLAADENTEEHTALGQSFLSIQGNRFTITSEQPTAQPLLSVGFDIPEDTKHLYLPNAFSTTAPHVEDRCIKVYGQKISTQNFYLAIQDVWGTVVYQTTSWEEASTQSWQGPAKASPVAVTYRYLLEGQYIGGKQFRKTGTIIQY